MTNRTILIVDDSSAARHMLIFSLRGAGFNLLEAESVEQALKILREEPVEMVLTDLRMPEVDGLELVRSIHSEDLLKGGPVIMITGVADEQARLDAREAGASAFIKKPFKPKQLLELVSSVLK